MPSEDTIRRLQRAIDIFCFIVAGLAIAGMAAHLVEAAPRIAQEVAAR